jgi:hypothetical protein
MLSIACFDFGLSESQFWDLTPAKFSALFDRVIENKREAFLRSGIIASTIANVNRGKGKSPYKPEDFMPKFDGGKHKEMTADQMKHMAMVITKAFGGTVKGEGFSDG